METLVLETLVLFFIVTGAHGAAPTSLLAWESESLGEIFGRHNTRCEAMEAVCGVITNVLGWELRLEIDRSLQRSQVCRRQDVEFARVFPEFDDGADAVVDGQNSVHPA